MVRNKSRSIVPPTRADFDDFDFPDFNQYIKKNYYAEVTQVYYIYNVIEAPIEYVDLIHALDTAQPGQEIHLRIATDGGDVDGAVAILHAIGRTQAKVVTHADSNIYSAGTLLFLAGHEMRLYPHSNFMFHHCSTAVGRNKNGDNLKHLSFVEEQMNMLYQTYYYPYFSEDEIDAIREGEDFWLTSEEMEQRLVDAIPILEEMIKKYQEETEEKEIEPVKTTKRKRKTVEK